MVQLDTAKARIIVVADEAKPRSEPVHIATKKVVAFHLSRGSDGTNRPALFAFDFSGEVDLKSGTRDELGRFKFGFVQFGRQGIMQMVYQGRKPEEGHDPGKSESLRQRRLVSALSLGLLAVRLRGPEADAFAEDGIIRHSSSSDPR